MRAVAVQNGHGPASAMFIDDTVPDPVAECDRVVVRIKAFVLNRMDIWQRQQAYPYKLPEETHRNIMGVEFSGLVEQLGPECTKNNFKPGDRVFGLVYGGAYAEKVSISEKMLMHLPSELSFEEGAGIPETFFTASQAINLVGEIPPNANVLIHAGASGVGQAAIQVTRLAGAKKIFTTAGTPEKCELVKILVAPWLPLWVLPSKWNELAIVAFFLQFFYGATIGNLGNLMQQLFPHPGMRAAFTGVAYNIGNAISSIAPTIETSLGERFPTADGTPDYARTQMILVGIVIALLVTTLVSMLLKTLNEEWDEEDPNMAIPTVPHPKDLDVEMGRQDASGSGKSETQAVHIEQAKGNDGSITTKP